MSDTYDNRHEHDGSPEHVMSRIAAQILANGTQFSPVTFTALAAAAGSAVTRRGGRTRAKSRSGNQGLRERAIRSSIMGGSLRREGDSSLRQETRRAS